MGNLISIDVPWSTMEYPYFRKTHIWESQCHRRMQRGASDNSMEFPVETPRCFPIEKSQDWQARKMWIHAQQQGGYIWNDGIIF